MPETVVSRCRNGFVVALFLLVLPGCGYGSKVQHGNIEVFYTEGATKAEADRLGVYLVKVWGNPADRRSVQLKKTGASYQFRMVVKKEFQNDQEKLKQLEFDGARMSRDVFDGAAVEMHACDEYFNTVKTITPRADTRYGIVEGNVELFYATDADKVDAQRLAKYLAAMPWGVPVTFKLARRDATVEIHMVIQKERKDDPVVIASAQQYRNAVAANVFKGTPVEWHLCDEVLNVVRVIKK